MFPLVPATRLRSVELRRVRVRRSAERV